MQPSHTRLKSFTLLESGFVTEFTKMKSILQQGHLYSYKQVVATCHRQVIFFFYEGGKVRGAKYSQQICFILSLGYLLVPVTIVC